MPARTLSCMILILALCGSVAACAPRSFERFMDHPVLSWLPLGRWGVVPTPTDRARPSKLQADPQCSSLAEERVAYLDRNEFSGDDIRKLMQMNYDACIAAKR